MSRAGQFDTDYRQGPRRLSTWCGFVVFSVMGVACIGNLLRMRAGFSLGALWFEFGPKAEPWLDENTSFPSVSDVMRQGDLYEYLDSNPFQVRTTKSSISKLNTAFRFSCSYYSSSS